MPYLVARQEVFPGCRATIRDNQGKAAFCLWEAVQARTNETAFLVRTSRHTENEAAKSPLKSAENALMQLRVAADGHDGNRLISVSTSTDRKIRHFRVENYATNHVGMKQCAETCSMRFSAHAGRLHACLDG